MTSRLRCESSPLTLTKPRPKVLPALLRIFWGFGGELVDSNGNPVFFEGKNAEALIKTYNFYNDAVNVYGISPEDSVGSDDRTSQAMIFADEVSMWTANHAMIIRDRRHRRAQA